MTFSVGSLLRVVSLALLTSWLFGCSDGSDDQTRDGGVVDGTTMDVPRTRDAGQPCTRDSECDDGIECTVDMCAETGFCRSIPEHSMCTDGLFCNGLEQCRIGRGCVAGEVETCDDLDVCTIDRCDETTKTCERTLRDFDEDGEVDWHCEDGTDCDDRDPLRGGRLEERCGDGIDNDCDEDADESECISLAHDTCDDPLDVSGGGAFEIRSGGYADYVRTCGGPAWGDVVLRLELTEPHDVRVRARNDAGLVSLALRTTCADQGTERKCVEGTEGDLRMRALPKGTYYVLLSASDPSLVRVNVELAEPTPAPTHETCSTPIDVSDGGTFSGSFVDVDDDVQTSCGSDGSPDLAYRFRLTESHDVVVALRGEDEERVSFVVQTECGEEESEIRCGRGGPVRGRLHSLEPGTYTLLVEGDPAREGAFMLDVTYEEPTEPPAGDRCAEAIPLTLGDAMSGTLADKEDDYKVSCGFDDADAVYTFDLEAVSDVSVRVASDDASIVHVAARSDCDRASAEVRCASGSPSQLFLPSLPAGRYYVLLESSGRTGFNVRVNASAPSGVIDVTGNDTCATAHEVPTAGGAFRGSTSMLANDLETSSCGSMARSRDAVFSIVLTRPRRVVASTEGSTYDTVLHRHGAACSSRAELACNDDAPDDDGVTSLLDEQLEAGTYYYVVDGFGASSSGEYVLRITTSAL